MKFTNEETKKAFVADYNSKKFKSKLLIKKYNFSNSPQLYGTITALRKEKLIPASKLSLSLKRYYDNKNIRKANSPIAEYRTVYFRDFSVQIHKKAMARLVVDHNNNLHILNS